MHENSNKEIGVKESRSDSTNFQVVPYPLMSAPVVQPETTAGTIHRFQPSLGLVGC